MKIRSLLVISTLLSFLFAANVFAATFNVSTTAQFRKALEDAAVNGEDDTIILEAGTYKTTDDSLGTFKFSDTEAHNLTIKAKDGLTATDVILDGATTHQVFNLTNTNDATYTIERITIQNGKTSGATTGGGIYSGNSLNITNCSITNNTSTGNGGGVYVYGDTVNVTVTNSTISNNTAGTYGGGIYCYKTITLSNSTVSNNTSVSAGGGISGDTVTVTGSSITNNTSANGACINGNAITINSSEISGCTNEGIRGGAVTIINSKVTKNKGYGSAGIYGAPAIIINSTISENTTDGASWQSGSALYCPGGSPAVIINSSIIGNVAASGSSIRCNTGSVYVNNIFNNNSSDVYFAGNSNIYNNYIDYAKLANESNFTIIKKNNIQPSEGNLNFADASFRLGVGSIAIDKGLDSNSDIFKNLFTDSTILNTVLDALYSDKDGNTRIAGSAIDLGAYEYGSSVAPIRYTLTITKSASGGAIMSLPASINYYSNKFATGTQITLTAAPSNGYGVEWSGACTGTSTTCALTMDADKAVTATFKQVYTLTVTLSGTGSGSVSATGLSCSDKTCTGTYSSGASISLTATPATGSTFGGWSGGGCSGTGVCVTTVNYSTSVTATFTSSSTSTTYALTVTKSGSGDVSASTGSISWSGNTGTANYNSATQVTLTATAASGYTFTGWSGACSGTGTCAVTMSAAKAVTAIFTASDTTGGTTGGTDGGDGTTTQYSLSVTKSGNGTVTSSPTGISCGADCSKSFDASTVVTLTAVPESGATFVGWSGACKGSSATCELTIDSDKIVSAAFRDSTTTKTYTITASAGKGGTIDQKGKVKVYQGMNITFNVTPGTGYEIADVKADGKSVKTQLEGNYYTFTNVTGNHSITATFKLKTIPVAVTAGANGRITPSVSSIGYGKTKVFTVTPNEGYVVKSVTIGGVEQDLSTKNITKGIKFTVSPEASASSVSVAATFRVLKTSDYLSAINIQPGSYQYSVKTCYKSVCVTPISFSTAQYFDADDLYDLFDQLVDSYDEGTCSFTSSNLKATAQGFVYSRNWECDLGLGLSVKGSAAFTFAKSP